MKALLAILGAAGGGTAAWFLFKKGGPLATMFGAAAAPDGLGVQVRQIRRYAFASAQDKSPVVGLTHASYALVLLDTAQEVVGKAAIAAAGIDPDKLRTLITKLQDMHAEKMTACDPYLKTVVDLERRDGTQIPGFVFA